MSNQKGSNRVTIIFFLFFFVRQYNKCAALVQLSVSIIYCYCRNHRLVIILFVSSFTNFSSVFHLPTEVLIQKYVCIRRVLFIIIIKKIIQVNSVFFWIQLFKFSIPCRLLLRSRITVWSNHFLKYFQS